jgi:hypothetical protein
MLVRKSLFKVFLIRQTYSPVYTFVITNFANPLGLIEVTQWSVCYAYREARALSDPRLLQDDNCTCTFEYAPIKVTNPDVAQLQTPVEAVTTLIVQL